ncbi:MAG: hypothetical protein ABIV48_06365 [Pyrinomonadaceae bacterium]
MIDKSKIKIVKKTEAAAAKSKLKIKRPKVASSRTAAREVVSTVTEWVSDLKQRKTEETKAAFELLFSTNQRTSQS